MNYYDENAKSFIDNTFQCDMSYLYSQFEKYVKGGSLLDIGFGSGRDMIYFQNKGYDVYGIDPSKKMCEHAKTIGLNNVYCMSVLDISFSNKFDCIWACASLLHIPSFSLSKALDRCYRALKKEGVMYCSFKYGTFEGERGNRFYLDMDEEKLSSYIPNSGFTLLKTFITEDVRQDNRTKWINILLKK